MAKVIHIRDVPDEVHAALADAARSQGVSLTRYVQHELKQLAERKQMMQHNIEVIRSMQERVGGSIDREVILEELHNGRPE